MRSGKWIYKFNKPSAGRRRFVRYYTQREAQLGASTHTVGVPARSSHLLDFEFGTPLEIRRAGTDAIRKPDSASLVGLETHRRHYLLFTGNVESFAIQFQPDAIYQLFRLPGLRITDCDYAAHDVLGSAVSELQQRLGNAQSFEERVQIADRFIAGQSISKPVRDSIELVTNQIMRNNGRCRVDVLAHDSGQSIRSFQRSFREHVGVSPKLYSRIVRFEAAASTKAMSTHISWTTIAHEFGYHDQMHLIHDFRLFSGDNPSGLLSNAGIVFPPVQSADQAELASL